MDKSQLSSNQGKVHKFAELATCRRQNNFRVSKKAESIIMSKDSDFLRLVDKYGPPPKIIWITCGNTSNAKMREVLEKSLQKAIDMLQAGEPVVEIGDGI